MSNPADDAPNDLTFATDDELLTELGKRYAGIVFAAERKARTDGESEIFYQWIGPITLATGLACRLNAFILRTVGDDELGDE